MQAVLIGDSLHFSIIKLDLLVIINTAPLNKPQPLREPEAMAIA